MSLLYLSLYSDKKNIKSRKPYSYHVFYYCFKSKLNKMVEIISFSKRLITSLMGNTLKCRERIFRRYFI